jgi:type I restriction enzyme S subunit
MNAIQQLLTDHIDIWTAAETEKKTGRGRASGNTGSVYGIKKLRELILELAVRGKLVPQDAKDEPASELLKRIQTEKAKLIAEGKIKKGMALAAITEDEKPFWLPMGWEWVRFADLVNVLNGRAYKKEELIDAGTPVLRVGNLFTSEHWYYSDLVLEEDKYCNKGDLLFAWSASFGPFIWDGDKAIYHYHIWKLDLYGGDLLYKRYLYTFLLEQTQKIKAAGHGVMMIHMTKEKMEKLVVYLPPFAEQHRIVTKVDELMALCDQLENQHSNATEAHEKLVSHLLGTLTQSQNAEDFSANWQRIAAHFDTLFTTDVSIEALKQTLLQLAVMGKLVPQDENDEPASELLKRIQAEKVKLIAEGKIKKDKPLPPIAEKEKPFKLPKSWEWVQLGTMSEFINGDRGKNYPNRSEYVSNGIPWINTGHIEPDGTLTPLEMNYISKEKFDSLNGGKIQLGDLVYCLRGATFGKTAIVDPYFEGAIASSLMIIRPNTLLSKEFMYRYLVSQTGKSQIFRFDNGSAQPNLSANNVKLYVYPLPPLTEQHRIVAKIDELMVLCDQLKSRITDARQLQQKLADVLVEQAEAVRLHQR